MSTGTFILAVILAMYAELHNGDVGPGVPQHRRALERHIRRHTGKLDWDGFLQFERAMRAALIA